MGTIILGAGISGLTVASALSQMGAEDYTLYEQDSSVGGLCRGLSQRGFTFDLLGHVLHFRSEEAKRFVTEILGGNLELIERDAWIYYRDHYLPYPFQLHLGFLPWPEKVACFRGYGSAWLRRHVNGRRRPENFEDWVQWHLGSGIARHFMFPYNSKLWGVPPGELSIDWVRPFVPGGSLRQVVGGALTRQTKEAGYNRRFYYPKRGGMQVLVDGLRSRARSVSLNRRVVGVDLLQKCVRFEDGERAQYDGLVSSIPLSSLVLQAEGVPEDLRRAASRLRCTSLLNLVFCLATPVPIPYHWVYFPEPQFPFFRIVFPSNICPSLAPAGSGILSVEVSNPDMTRADDLEEQVVQALLALGLVGGRAQIVTSVRHYVSHAYPVHDRERPTHVARLLAFLRSRDVWSIGRFGAWQYSSIDDAIAAALRVAQEISGRSLVATREVVPD